MKIIVKLIKFAWAYLKFTAKVYVIVTMICAALEISIRAIAKLVKLIKKSK